LLRKAYIGICKFSKGCDWLLRNAEQISFKQSKMLKLLQKLIVGMRFYLIAIQKGYSELLKQYIFHSSLETPLSQLLFEMATPTPPLLVNADTLSAETLYVLCDVDGVSNRLVEKRLTMDELLGICLINNIAPPAGQRGNSNSKRENSCNSRLTNFSLFSCFQTRKPLPSELSTGCVRRESSSIARLRPPVAVMKKIELVPRTPFAF
jgi:hypothetical protein